MSVSMELVTMATKITKYLTSSHSSKNKREEFGGDLAISMSCSACNVRFLGVQHLCGEPRNATNCIGCLKTVAKVKLRDSGYMDGWERLSEVVSRLCIMEGNLNVKPAGCYKQLNNGGYTERCYCYTDNCNSAATRLLPRLHLSLYQPLLGVQTLGLAASYVLILLSIMES